MGRTVNFIVLRRERKNMKKKIILAILTGILTTGILSACGDNAQEKIEISESATETYILKQPTTEAESAVETENSDNAQASVAETEEESLRENTSASDDLIQSYLNSITLETAEQKGVCGNDLIWFYKDNVLVIRGTGPMTDFDYFLEGSMPHQETTPWAELEQEIQWVIIDNGCTHIGKSSFVQSPLSKIILPDSLQSIGEEAFEYCESLTEIDLPDSLQSIGDSAFSGCRLTEIDLPDSLQSIGDWAFSGCRLTEIDLPASLQSVGDSAFSGCRLTEINLPDSLQSVWDSAFSGCRLTEIDLPDSVQSIGDSAFANCNSLTEIKLSDSLQSIGSGAFYGCESLTKIDLPDSLQSIGDSAFAYCNSLTEINLPASLQSVGERAFEGCGLNEEFISKLISDYGYIPN